MKGCYHCYRIKIVSFASSVYFWSEILNPFIMKAKFLPFLLLTVLLQVSMFSFAHEMISARQIRLKNKTEVQHRSIPVTPDAFIENSLLSIDLLSTVPTVAVTIKDAETGEVVYTSTDLNVDKVYIDLAGEEKVNILWRYNFRRKPLSEILN